jgi:uncharacterized RDD family membrane protein YckC
MILGLLCYLPGTRGPDLPEYVIGYVGFIFNLGIRTSELWGLDRASLSELAGRGGFLLGCLLYLTLCEARGQTLGKRMFGVRVVKADGGRFVTYPQALVRVLSFVLTSIPLGVGQVAMLWDQQRRSWSDHIAGTRVVRVPWAGSERSLARPVNGDHGSHGILLARSSLRDIGRRYTSFSTCRRSGSRSADPGELLGPLLALG